MLHSVDERLTLSEFRSPSADASVRSALLDAVDYGLLALGEIVRDTIYQCIEESHQVRREEIPDNLDTFYMALKELLGQEAESIKRLIMKHFFSRFGVTFTEREPWTSICRKYFLQDLMLPQP
jgi:hypothetical protein